MNAGERYGNRIQENLMMGVIALLASVFGQIFATLGGQTTEATVSFDIAVGLLQSLPGILTLAGIAVATIIAGPLGFIGAIAENVAVASIFNPEVEPNIGLLFFGALLVVIGTPIPWLKILSEVLS